MKGARKVSRIRVRRLLRDLQRQRKHPFSNAELSEVATKQGVYIVYAKRGEVVHVGRTIRRAKGLNQRLRDHVHGRSSFMENYRRDGRKLSGSSLEKGYKFQYLIVEDDVERTLLESLASGTLCPSYVGTGIKRK